MVEYSEAVGRSVVLQQVVGHFELVVWYTSKHEYEINVKHLALDRVKTSVKSATYEPIFGIDQMDLQMILAEAEALCEQFEEENKA